MLNQASSVQTTEHRVLFRHVRSIVSLFTCGGPECMHRRAAIAMATAIVYLQRDITKDKPIDL